MGQLLEAADHSLVHRVQKCPVGGEEPDLYKVTLKHPYHPPMLEGVLGHCSSGDILQAIGVRKIFLFFFILF